MSSRFRSTVGGIDEKSCGVIGPFLLAHGGEVGIVDEAKRLMSEHKGVCIVDFENETKSLSTSYDESEPQKKTTIEDVQFDAIVQMPTDTTYSRLPTMKERMERFAENPSKCMQITKDKCTKENIQELQTASTFRAKDAQTGTKVKSATWVEGDTIEQIEKSLPAKRESDQRGFTLFMCANKTMGIDENANCFGGGDASDANSLFASMGPPAAAAAAPSAPSAPAAPARSLASLAIERTRIAAGLAGAAADALRLAADMAAASGGVRFSSMRELASRRSRLIDMAAAGASWPV